MTDDLYERLAGYLTDADEDLKQRLQALATTTNRKTDPGCESGARTEGSRDNGREGPSLDCRARRDDACRRPDGRSEGYA